MKAPALLAAVLLLPASIAPSGEVLTAGPAPVPGGRIPVLPASAGRMPAEPAWEWPLAPRPRVLRAFDPPDKPWMSGHRGVDLGAAHDGVPVTTPESGTVSFVGVVVDRPVVTIDHGNGLRSSFEPVDSSLRAGDAVAKGDTIGTLLPGHCGTRPCVHWGVRRGEEYLNPLRFVVDLRPSVLLPLGPGQGTP
ncbi:M23 family metallopeptidase [Arthrobacter sp. R4]|uniref:M23 family metallopeptidase n=1 Tax=Arthrobacter sp. R4 TaxID=644417 RepID=UPI003ED90F9E